MTLNLEIHPLTPDRWQDFEALFGERGACGGCWCMWWRSRYSDFMRQRGEQNRKAMKQIVESGKVPGIIAYTNGQPIAWCSISPREDYMRLEKSRNLKRIDDKPVWSVVCFYVAKPYRGKGVTVKLLEAAVNYAREHGGKIVEGYPLEPKKGRLPDAFVYTGLVSTFRNAGFSEVLRRSETRPIMRRVVKE